MAHLADTDADVFPQDIGIDGIDDCFSHMDILLPDASEIGGPNNVSQRVNREIEQAPLLSDKIISRHAKERVPQFSLLGCVTEQPPARKSVTKIFQNTNTPFATFVCGVQGSGKSHTTASMLENALISSRHLGTLQDPVSALVFNYGKWSSNGNSFNISEATYLGAADPALSTDSVKKVTVLVSPTNRAIHKLYEKHPNVEVLPFYLHPKALDITALRALMGMEDENTPLYMSKVEKIVREIAAQSEDGCLDYRIFKQKIKQQEFDAKQSTMLAMRLDVLESFLDLKGNAKQASFGPGEVTIIDLSDPFVTPSVACVLFKLGMDQFQESSRKAKMIVLDEAHKYMLDSSGSEFLTKSLDQTIRLQRHEGTRVIISTQEPTVSTVLIGLCSVIVIHRFTSPAWYAALKHEINVMENDKVVLQQIEGLATGEALVYAPGSVLDQNPDGSVVKAPGRLMKMNIRKRITKDGGESVMAVSKEG